MTTKKPRKMWILTTPSGDSLFYADEPMNHDWVCCSKTLYLEVLPEPTDAELDDLALKHASQFADDNLVAFHESGLDFKMGFRAALKWMKGESE